MNLVVFGAPGSGKGTQSERLIDHYGLYHISTGDLLRRNINSGTELGKIADSYISKGQLIPDGLMISILADELDNHLEETARGVIFDGFPRTIPQARELNAMLAKRGSKVHAVIGLDVPEDELVDRLLERGRVSGRSDDNLETIKKRLEVYHSQTSPLKEFYKNQGNYHHIHGSGEIKEIFKRITDALDALDKD